MRNLDRLPPFRAEPLLYNPPSQGDQLFYLLLTIAGSTTVYKSFTKSLRGIATIGVASFGVYHILGLNCEHIRRVVSNFFKNSPDRSNRSLEYSYTFFDGTRCSDLQKKHESTNPFLSGSSATSPALPFSNTGGVDQGERQTKRR